VIKLVSDLQQFDGFLQALNTTDRHDIIEILLKVAAHREKIPGFHPFDLIFATSIWTFSLVQILSYVPVFFFFFICCFNATFSNISAISWRMIISFKMLGSVLSVTRQYKIV
jgi:hypothetical protein